MDYQFYWDTACQPVAQCELDTELFGDWLTNDIGANQQEITLLLNAITHLLSQQTKQFNYSRGEYHLHLDRDEAELSSKFSQVVEEDLPEGTDMDETTSCGCGLEDLQHLLLAWQEFINQK